MATWTTLTIFEYGETQLIVERFNKKVLTSKLTKVQAVVDSLYSFKPEKNLATENYYIINIINNHLGIWIPRDAEEWRTEYIKLDAVAIEELVAEIAAYNEVTEEVVSEEAPTSEETPAAE
jgi:hypothetical protein